MFCDFPVKMADSENQPDMLALEQILHSVRVLQEMLVLVGLLYVGKVTIELLFYLYQALRVFVLARLIKEDLVKRYGRWAVVTGCTDGIGKQYSVELAKRGLNLVLISRNLDRLHATSNELMHKYGVDTRIVQADFAQGRSIYEKVALELQDLDIGILVNNVGVMHEYPMPFEEVTEESIWRHINVNISAMTMMTNLVLPGMVRRQRGAIVNLSSSAAMKPVPLMSVYSATKAYVDFFSRAIHYEYRKSGIFVQSVVPFYIATAMTSFSSTLHNDTGLFVPNATTFARSAVATIGWTSRTTGYWTHGVQYYFGNRMPEWMFLLTASIVQSFLRKDALRGRKLNSGDITLKSK